MKQRKRTEFSWLAQISNKNYTVTVGNLNDANPISSLAIIKLSHAIINGDDFFIHLWYNFQGGCPGDHEPSPQGRMEKRFFVPHAGATRGVAKGK